MYVQFLGSRRLRGYNDRITLVRVLHLQEWFLPVSFLIDLLHLLETLRTQLNRWSHFGWFISIWMISIPIFHTHLLSHLLHFNFYCRWIVQRQGWYLNRNVMRHSCWSVWYLGCNWDRWVIVLRHRHCWQGLIFVVISLLTFDKIDLILVIHHFDRFKNRFS